MKALSIILFWLCATALPPICLADGQLVKVRYTVVDENRVPVPGAEVGASVWTGRRFFSRKESFSRTYITDTHGQFTFSERVRIDAGFTVRKEGYYESLHTLHMSKWERDGGHWPPNPGEDAIVLKRIVNPIAMKVKRVRKVFPAQQQRVAYDLVAGDWCVPQGSGTHPDMFFSFRYQWTDNFHYALTMDVDFPDQGAGLQEFYSDYFNQHFFGSALRSHHLAPETGYTNRYTMHKSADINGRRDNSTRVDTTKEDRNFYFKIRPDGIGISQPMSAMYGKIYSDVKSTFILLNPNPTNPAIRVEFLYYLNTNGTQNIECHTSSVFVDVEGANELQKKYPPSPYYP